MEIESDSISISPSHNNSIKQQKKNLAKICKQKKLYCPNPTKKIRKLSNSSMTTQASSEDNSSLSQQQFLLDEYKECKSPKDFLLKHNILPTHYAKMVDWLTQINDVFKSSEQTLFLSINIMQRYFEKEEKLQNSRDLHLIGIVSWFIASKFEDIYPVEITQVKNKLANSEFSIEEIQEKEVEILEALDYQLNFPNLFNYCCAIISEINLEEIVGEKIAELINDAIALVSLMCQCDYKLLKGYQMNEMVGAVIYTAIKIVAIKVQMLDTSLEKLMSKVYYINGQCNKNCLMEVQLLAKNFAHIHLGMNYVEKFGKYLICQLKEIKKVEVTSL